MRQPSARLRSVPRLWVATSPSGFSQLSNRNGVTKRPVVSNVFEEA